MMVISIIILLDIQLYQKLYNLSNNKNRQMTEKLSSKFFGNKKFKRQHYDAFQLNKCLSDQQVAIVFDPYTSNFKQQLSEDGQCSRLTIFAEFINQNLKKFHHWQFQALSSWIELSAHVFEHSFNNCLNKKQSFDYFSQVLVRHSLFRPPHSVKVFQYEQCQKMTDYWIGTFSRFYEEYAECFALDFNEILETRCAPECQHQMQLKQGKQIEREKLGDKLIQQLGVVKKPVQEKPNEES